MDWLTERVARTQPGMALRLAVYCAFAAYDTVPRVCVCV